MWVASGAVVSCLVLVALTVAPEAEADDDPALACQPSYVSGIGNACRLADDLYEVFLTDGATLLTHGLDPILPDQVGFALSNEQRAPVCAQEWRMHVLYGRPATNANQTDSILPQIRDHIRRTNALLNADALESGNVQADFRVACDTEGEIRVDVFEGPNVPGAVANTDFQTIVDAARAKGHSKIHTDYLIFYDDTHESACGVGSASTDSTLSANNEAMGGPDYGVVFKDCWFTRTPMHENGHNQGAVHDMAPGSDFGGHCYEQQDVMCYPYSDLLLGVFEFCDDRSHYDCGFDTYFDAAPESGEWLASNWNIGSRLNKYIAFSDTLNPPVAEPTATASTSAPPSSPSPTQTPTGAAAVSPSASHGPAPTSHTPTATSSATSATSSEPPGEQTSPATSDPVLEDSGALKTAVSTPSATPFPGLFALVLTVGAAVLAFDRRRG